MKLYSPILSFFRILPMSLWLLFGYFLQLFVNSFARSYFFNSYRLFFTGLVSIFGIKIKISGNISKRKTLFVSNHISYLDILVLGSKVNAIFVAKSEIDTWPLINRFTSVGKTIFVSRKDKTAIKDQMNLIEKSLKDNYSVILFPEGTSSDGLNLLPFKSSLLGIIENKNMMDYYLQPITLSYNKLDGIPVDLKYRPFLAWFGAMDLFSHAWKFLGLGRCEVDLNFHKPLKFRDFSNRKVASEYAYKLISGQILRNNNSKEVSKVIKLNEFKIL